MSGKIGIIDCGVGNISSLNNAISQVVPNVCISKDPDVLVQMDKLILAGVGSFPHYMSNLINLGLDQMIYQHVEQQKPILGICIGMQLLFTEGYERDCTRGLGLIDGTVRKLESAKSIRVPHMGWNDVFGKDMAQMDVFSEIPNHGSFYFAHSYHAVIRERIPTVCTDFYGQDIVAGLQKGFIHGVQFHPEKSQTLGLSLLKNYILI